MERSFLLAIGELTKFQAYNIKLQIRGSQIREPCKCLEIKCSISNPVYQISAIFCRFTHYFSVVAYTIAMVDVINHGQGFMILLSWLGVMETANRECTDRLALHDYSHSTFTFASTSRREDHMLW